METLKHLDIVKIQKLEDSIGILSNLKEPFKVVDGNDEMEGLTKLTIELASINNRRDEIIKFFTSL